MARIKWITPRGRKQLGAPWPSRTWRRLTTWSRGSSQSPPPWGWRWSPRTLRTCTPAQACRNSQSSCPVQSHGTVRDGGIWRAHHRAGELQFKICLKDVTEDLYSPQEAKPCCPLPEIMSKGTNLRWLSKLPASQSSLPPPLRMPFWFNIFVPFLWQSSHKISTCYSNFNSFQSVEIISAGQC